MRKKLTMAAMFILSCIASATAAFAFDPGIDLVASYSDEIEPQENDIFVLQYKIANTPETANMTIDASLIADAIGHISLDAADYEIVGIVYEGDNPEIENYGYAVMTEFTVDNQKDYNEEITIAIGDNKVRELYQLYPNLLLHRRGEYAESITEFREMSTPTPTPEYKVRPAVTAPPEDEEELDVSETSETSEDSTSESLIEEKTELVSSNKSNGPWYANLIPVAILAVIGGIIIFIVHKKGIV